jgi:hypothetical protein
MIKLTIFIPLAALVLPRRPPLLSAAFGLPQEKEQL